MSGRVLDICYLLAYVLVQQISYLAVVGKSNLSHG